MKKILLIGAVLWSTSAFPKPPVMLPEPATKPDWSRVRETGESSLRSTLFDPSSAQITYISGFQWGYSKPVFAKRTWGWIACGMLNAKNRLGGYVGAEGFWILADASGAVTTGMQASTISTCDAGVKAEVQPELRDVAAVENAANGRLGVAEELTKLADLKAKGIITQAEFDTQKAKLLAR